MQTGLGLSVHRFAQLREEEVRREVKVKGLMTTRLATNEMRRNVLNIVDTLISRFKKRKSLQLTTNLFETRYPDLYT